MLTSSPIYIWGVPVAGSFLMEIPAAHETHKLTKKEESQRKRTRREERKKERKKTVSTQNACGDW